MTSRVVSTFKARKVMPVSCLNCIAEGGQQVRTEFGLWTDYDIQTFRFNTTRNTQTDDGVATVTDFEFGDRHNNPLATVTSGSDGLNRRREFTYAGDAVSGVPAAMFDKVASGSAYRHMIGHIVRKRELTEGTTTSAAELTYADVQGKILLTREREFPSGQQDFRETSVSYTHLRAHET